MIDKALDALKTQLQDYLKRLPDLTITSSDTVQLSNITKDDGNIAIPKDSLGLTLINIEEERVNKAQSPVAMTQAGKTIYVNPELRLNLYLLLSANFTTYLTGIKYLSSVIGFFQSKHVFTPADTPSLDPSMEKLVVELYSLNLEQQNHLWGYLGGKYLPSVVYKVRLVIIQEGMPHLETEPIRRIEVQEVGGA